MQDTRVTFRAKARTNEDTGERYVSLVSPAEHHIDGDRMVTARAVGVAWTGLFGHHGRVSENDALVESFGDGFMPTVTVNLGNVHTVTRFKSGRFWELVDEYRANGAGLLEAEDMAHEDMRRAVIESRN